MQGPLRGLVVNDTSGVRVGAAERLRTDRRAGATCPHGLI